MSTTPNSDDSSTTVTAGEEVSSTSATGATNDSGDSASEPSISLAPAEPYSDDPPADDDGLDVTAWVSRRSMTEDAIEMQWSAPTGAAEYQLHRIDRTFDGQPDNSAMTDSSLVNVAIDERGTYVDSEVTAGSSYWYGMRGVDTQGKVLSTGWHRADAVNDEQPPAPVELLLEVKDGEVWLSWNQPEDNYELASYNILRGVNGEEPESVSSVYNVDQTSFVDRNPPSGTVTYVVTAMDFHWNKSVPVSLTVDLPQ